MAWSRGRTNALSRYMYATEECIRGLLMVASGTVGGGLQPVEDGVRRRHRGDPRGDGGGRLPVGRVRADHADRVPNTVLGRRTRAGEHTDMRVGDLGGYVELAGSQRRDHQRHPVGQTAKHCASARMADDHIHVGQ